MSYRRSYFKGKERSKKYVQINVSMTEELREVLNKAAEVYHGGNRSELARAALIMYVGFLESKLERFKPNKNVEWSRREIIELKEQEHCYADFSRFVQT